MAEDDKGAPGIPDIGKNTVKSESLLSKLAKTPIRPWSALRPKDKEKTRAMYDRVMPGFVANWPELRREARDLLIESMHQRYHGNEVFDFVIRGGPVRLETMLAGDCGGLLQVMPLR